jgi:hypothetical protein
MEEGGRRPGEGERQKTLLPGSKNFATLRLCVKNDTG